MLREERQVRLQGAASEEKGETSGNASVGLKPASQKIQTSLDASGSGKRYIDATASKLRFALSKLTRHLFQNPVDSR